MREMIMDEIESLDKHSKSYKSALTVLSYLEPEYNCSGISKDSLFYFTQSVSKGVPQSTCLVKIEQIINNSVFILALVCLAAGAVIFIVWFTQIFV